MSIQLSCPTDGIWPETQVNERVQLSCSLLGNFVGEMYRTCYQDGSTAVWSVVEEKHCHSYFQIGGIGVIIVLGIVLVVYSVWEHRVKGTRTLPPNYCKESELLSFAVCSRIPKSLLESRSETPFSVFLIHPQSNWLGCRQTEELQLSTTELSRSRMMESSLFYAKRVLEIIHTFAWFEFPTERDARAVVDRLRTSAGRPARKDDTNQHRCASYAPKQRTCANAAFWIWPMVFLCKWEIHSLHSSKFWPFRGRRPIAVCTCRKWRRKYLCCCIFTNRLQRENSPTERRRPMHNWCVWRERSRSISVTFHNCAPSMLVAAALEVRVAHIGRRNDRVSQLDTRSLMTSTTRWTSRMWRIELMDEMTRLLRRS